MSITGNLRIFRNKRPLFTKVTKHIHFSYDFVALYDGGSIFAPQLGQYCNNSLPPTCHSGELIQNYKRILATGIFNPNWHELWKQDKWSSLVPPRGIFFKTHWAWQGAKLTRLMSVFTSKIVLKILIKIQLTKYSPKMTRGWQVPCLMPNRVKLSSNLLQVPRNYGKGKQMIVWKTMQIYGHQMMNSK